MTRISIRMRNEAKIVNLFNWCSQINIILRTKFPRCIHDNCTFFLQRITLVFSNCPILDVQSVKFPLDEF